MENTSLDHLSGMGMEDLEKQEAMPLLKLLGFQSPEVIDPEKQIEGAKPGDIIFSPTREILPQPIEFVVVAKTTLYAEWKPLSAGGGLVAHHPLTTALSPEDGGHPDYRMGSPTSQWDEFLGDNELRKTMYYCIRFKTGENWREGILAFTRSGLRSAGRPLNVMLGRFTYPPGITQKPFLWSTTYMLSSFLDKNDENSWYNWTVESGNVLDLETDRDFILETAKIRKENAVPSLPAPITHQTPVGALVVETDDLF